MHALRSYVDYLYTRSADVKRWHINCGVMWDCLVEQAEADSGGSSSSSSSSSALATSFFSSGKSSSSSSLSSSSSVGYSDLIDPNALVWGPRTCVDCGNPFCGLQAPRQQLLGLISGLRRLCDAGHPVALQFMATGDRSLAPEVVQLILDVALVEAGF